MQQWQYHPDFLVPRSAKTAAPLSLENSAASNSREEAVKQLRKREEQLQLLRTSLASVACQDLKVSKIR